MSTDQLLIVIAISAYIMSTLALFTYFLSRERLPKLIGIPFAAAGCGVQFFELGYRYQTSHIWPLTNLYGSLSLFSAMSGAVCCSEAALMWAPINSRMRASRSDAAPVLLADAGDQEDRAAEQDHGRR